MRRVAIAALVTVSALSVGCSDWDEHAGAPTAQSTTTTTAARPSSSDLADCPHRSSGSSPAVFDPTGGMYAAQSLAVLGGRRLRFDVVQWLSGEDANEAYLRDSGDDSGAPNDYYIVNNSNDLRTARVADDAAILVLRADGLADSLHPVPFGSIPTDEPTRTFWLTFGDGFITEICQQYRP